VCGGRPPSLLRGVPGRGRCRPSAILKSSADCASTEHVRRHHLDRRIAPERGRWASWLSEFQNGLITDDQRGDTAVIYAVLAIGSTHMSNAW
jgi:hypothetical protein